MRLTKQIPVLAFGFTLVLVAATQAQTFTATGSLNTPREEQTTTLLNNGMVLVTGGCGGSNGQPVASAELYNPSTGTFTDTGNMTSPRAEHQATLLQDGTVLITGGLHASSNDCDKVNAGILDTAELYSPTTGTFTAVGNMTSKRENHSATLLQNGEVLIAGGVIACSGNDCFPSTNSAELYNPSTKTFTATGSMAAKRSFHTATLLSDGTVLVAGGLNPGPPVYYSTGEIYNPSTGNFTQTTGSMSSVRWGHTAALLSSGEVLMVGGANNSGKPSSGGGTPESTTILSTAELYNPSTETFTTTGSMSTGRWDQLTGLLFDGTVLVAGGEHSGAALSTAEIYNPATGAFTLTGSMNDARWDYRAGALLPDGNFLVAGGMSNQSGTPLNEAELFNGPPPGFVNPKYVIVGVTYAPPGPQSSVTYTTTILAGTTFSASALFTAGVTTSVSVTIPTGIPGMSQGQIIPSESTSFTQSVGANQSLTLSKQSAESEKTTGTANAFSPVNHDYDTIWLWLNPVVLVNFPSSNNVLFHGFAFDECDQPTLDIFPVLVGQLNGDLSIDPSAAKVLARGWVTTNNCGQTFPSGQGPGLTSADFAAIIQADPFANSSYTFTLASGVNPATTTDGRFTIASDANGNPFPPLDYTQCNGGGCTSPTDTITYTAMSSLGQSASFTLSETFGLEEKSNTGANAVGISEDFKQSQTITFEATAQQTITSTTSQSGSVTVAPVPAPPPPYAGPGEFDVYQDNLYGTFAFIPVN